MHRSWLDDLVCPGCHEPFTWPGDGLELDRGILGCACGGRPVVLGIPMLCVEPEEVERVRTGSADAITAWLAEERLVAPDLWRAPPPTLEEALAVERAFLDTVAAPPWVPNWVDHLRSRFAAPVFMALRPLAWAVGRARPSAILDIGCGAGHFTREVLRAGGSGPTWALDEWIGTLVLSRWVLPPDTRVISANAEEGLPFRDGAFDAIVTSDTVTFLHDRGAVLDEIARVRRPEGAVAITRLRAQEHDKRGGSCLPTAAWAPLFAQHLAGPGLWFTDEDLRTRWAQGEPISLETAVPGGELTRRPEAVSFSYLEPASRCAEPLVFPDDLAGPAEDAIVNPDYQVEERDGQLFLRRNPGPAPGAIEPPATFVLALDRLADPAYRRELLRRSILIASARRISPRTPLRP